MILKKDRDRTEKATQKIGIRNVQNTQFKYLMALPYWSTSENELGLRYVR